MKIRFYLFLEYLVIIETEKTPVCFVCFSFTKNLNNVDMQEKCINLVSISIKFNDLVKERDI